MSCKQYTKSSPFFHCKEKQWSGLMLLDVPQRCLGCPNMKRSSPPKPRNNK